MRRFESLIAPPQSDANSCKREPSSVGLEYEVMAEESTVGPENCWTRAVSPRDRPIYGEHVTAV